MVLNIISFLIISLTLYTAFKDYKKDSSLIKKVYFERPLDYLWSFLMLVGVSILVFTCMSFDLPKFMTWSWFSLFSSDKSGGNVITTAFNGQSIVFIVLFWSILTLALPYLAKGEEEVFRSGVFGIKNRLLVNLKFGILHMIMGVPLFVALILSVVGYVYSIFYIRTFNEYTKKGLDFESSNNFALQASTSVHTKYNLIIVTIAAVVSGLLVCFG